MRALSLAAYCWLLVLASLFAVGWLLPPWNELFSGGLWTWKTILLVIALSQVLLWGWAAIESTLACIRGLRTGSPSQKAPTPGSAHSEFIDAWRMKARNALEQTADAIKDAIMDWGPGDEASSDTEAAELANKPLPPLAPEQFVEALRGQMEVMLEQTAEAINEAPTGQAIVRSEEKVCNLLADFVWDALALGLQMRSAAEAGSGEVCTASTRKTGRFKPLASLGSRLVWAEKYRRMRTADLAVRLARCAYS